MPTFDSPEPILAIIDVAIAQVRINASDRADTVVEVRPSDEHSDADVRAAEHIEVDYADGRLLVRADPDLAMPLSGFSVDKLLQSPSTWARSLLFGGEGSVEVTVGLPAGSRVDAKAAASLRCRGALDEVSFTTSYGDIQVEQARRLRLSSTHGAISVTRSTGHAEISTTHGDIRLGEIDGTAVVKTSHGEIRLREVTGELRLHSAHGDSTVDRALAGVVAKTSYGSVRIGEVVSGSVVMETTGGGLELGIREGSAAWLDVSSQYGTVDVSLDPTDEPGRAEQVVEVRAQTAYGDIVIHRS
ncbi:DUF4097 domain-containing protein [Nonomuraea glycinis]|uniref:DUF4097 domain-containing protein n=1 Tax=Nonomuraea glycinis TaxID=2047744 RepID=A0A918EAC6_9ACTN|nr:DUF4097 family beta strand repeat-containing protein [Nonomuraea glycinis]MCA2182568.1 DUF4097 domain-containing protein [Nonomuraea glycinis]GGP16954.1 hypothetical protein GCM10012278_82820 [Nonomuraea glycinis]